MSIEYTTRDGEKVCIPMSMDPFRQLEIRPSASLKVTKDAVKRKMIKPKRQDRALASMAYHMITSSGRQYQKMGTIYQVISPDIFVYASIGHSDQVIAEIEKDPRLVKSVDGHKRTVVYLAARCGFSDIVEKLVHKGADVNHRQCDNSTPLHVAAFYGQKDIVRILLAYGADPTLKNSHGNTAVEEASEELKSAFADYESSPFQYTLTFFKSSDLTDGMRNILYRGRRIGAEIFRSMSQLDENTRSQWNTITRDWEVAYHGTKHKNIKSILTHGLFPSGAKLPNGETIRPPSNHIPLKITFAGVEDWARAIFVSPSIMYASNKSFSEYVHRGDTKWCVIMKVFVKPVSYKSYDSTLLAKEQPIEGEPVYSEYRVEDDVLFLRVFSDFSDFLVKVEMFRNVVVASVLFIDLDFRQEVKDNKLNHDDLRRLFTPTYTSN